MRITIKKKAEIEKPQRCSSSEISENCSQNMVSAVRANIRREGKNKGKAKSEKS